MAKSSDKSMLFLLGCLAALVVACLVCVGGGFLMPYKLWTSSSPTEPAKAYLKEHPAVKEHLGEVSDFGKFPSNMNVNTNNGKGKAHMEFQLKGSKGAGTAVLDMAKEPNKPWTVVWGELDVDGKKIPLTGGSPPPPPKPESDPFPPMSPPPAEDEGSAKA